MPRDPLMLMRTLRRRAVDEAHRGVVEAVQALDDAEWNARTVERQIEEERRQATDLEGDDGIVEAFAAWLPQARRRALTARGEQESRLAELGVRRAEMNAAERALEVTESLLRQRRELETAQELRQAQHLIDEVAQRARNPA